MTTLTNTGAGPDGGYDRHGRPFVLNPGETRDVPISRGYAAILIRRKGNLQLAGVEAAKPEPKGKQPEAPQTDTTEFDDDVGRIKGIGPALKAKLDECGVTSIRQIADLTEEQIAALDQGLNLKGAIERQDWIGQAKALIPAETPAE